MTLDVSARRGMNDAAADSGKSPWQRPPTVCVAGPSDDARRRRRVDEAVTFWNRAFVRLGCAFRFGVVGHTTWAPPDDVLARLSASIVAGRSAAADLLRPFDAVRGDVVLVLSEDELTCFSTNPGRGRVVIGIGRHRRPPNGPWFQRNIIAHELGHALGLAHNTEASSLMCTHPRTAWTRPSRDDAPLPRILPLTAKEEGDLQRLYPPAQPQ